ncbi:MAG: lysostaphin resistance A-like protein [Gemmataceae bacterium]
MRWLGLAFEGGLGVLAWLLGWWLDVDPLATLYWDGAAVGIGLLACVPMFGLFLFCLWCPWRPFARIREVADEFLTPLFAGLNWFDLLLLSAAAGLGEEMLFRGFIQAGLARPFGEHAGLLLASIIFGLMHLVTPAYGVLATIMGIYLGLVWLYAGNLLSVVVAHGVYDFIALLVLVRSTPQVVAPEADSHHRARA